MNRENWNLLSINECADVIGGGTPSTKNSDYWDGNIPWISPKDLSNNKDKYITNGERFITELGLEKSSAKLLPANSLLFSSRAPIGYLAINAKPVATNQGFKSLILKDEFDVEFFYYLFKQKTEFIKSFASGSTFQEVSGSVVKNLSFLIPPKQEQEKISNILSKLDKKIELNQKMNKILEEIAKTLFKSWFIDFDPVRAKAEGRPTGLSPEISDLFPDELVESEIGEIPKGWKSNRIEEICEKIAMGPFGSNIKVSTFVDDGVPIISGHHLHNLLLKEGNHKFITEEHAERLKNSVVRSGDVVFTHAGTVGQVSLIPKNCDYSKYVISQRQFYARTVRPEYGAFLNFFFHTAIGQHKLLSNVSGSGVPSIARPSSHLKAIELIIPDEILVSIFDQKVAPIIDRMVLVSKENETLSELRDTLLPKLISGELTIPDAENLVEEAGI